MIGKPASRSEIETIKDDIEMAKNIFKKIDSTLNNLIVSNNKMMSMINILYERVNLMENRQIRLELGVNDEISIL